MTQVWLVEKHVSPESDMYFHMVVAVCATEALAQKTARDLFEREIDDVLLLRRERKNRYYTPDNAEQGLKAMLQERRPLQGYPAHPRIEMSLPHYEDSISIVSALFEEMYYSWRPAHVKEENT